MNKDTEQKTIENSHNVEQKIMSEIKSGKVRLRSRYLFLAERFGLSSAFFLSVILAVLFFNLVLFYLQSTDNLIYLSFGRLGIWAFLQSFPYMLVIALILFILLSGFILKRGGIAYHQPFSYLAVGLIIFIMLSGGVLAFVGVAEKIESGVFDGDRRLHRTMVILRPFLEPGVARRDSGLAGRIIEVNGYQGLLQTPQEIRLINLEKINPEIIKQLSSTTFVVGVGQPRGNEFCFHDLRVVSDDEIEMVRRGVKRCNCGMGVGNGINNLPKSQPIILP